MLIAADGLVALLEIAGPGKWLVVLQTMAEDAGLAWSGSRLAGICARFAIAAAWVVWVMDRASLERYVEGAPPVTDDQPRIEYATWVRQKELGRVLPRLLALRTMLPLRGANDVFLVAVADERDRLLRFYGAGLHAYNGERQLWALEDATGDEHRSCPLPQQVIPARKPHRLVIIHSARRVILRP